MNAYEIRLNNIKLMHNTMIDMNNENAYFAWIYIMPDEPMEDDFEWFAEDEERYIELYTSFMRIFNRYIGDGLFNPSNEVVDFAHKFKEEFDIFKWEH